MTVALERDLHDQIDAAAKDNRQGTVDPKQNLTLGVSKAMAHLELPKALTNILASSHSPVLPTVVPY